MSIPVFQVDAFTDKPFYGNPAAVCILPEPRDKKWMQLVAREMNLSETAFLHRRGDHFNLRWFTPAVEVDLCGHATLASAHILWETGIMDKHEQARFDTRSGMLTADLRDRMIELNFPAVPDEPSGAPFELCQALGIKQGYIGKTKFDYLVEVDSEKTVRDLSPDFSQLKTIPVRGIIVTAPASSPEYNFVSRFFAPGAGIDEDPVTGSSHCSLGPFWKRKTGRSEFVACQLSERGGIVHVRVDGDRVYIGGQAVTVLHGELTD
ncbi:PhzF family phenazine biosynthesis protein [bacterium]|nr:PhzF family phenazine biosynthesis protein [bacterium]